MFDRGLLPFASWSPDGEYLATADKIWRAQSRECFRRFSISGILRYRVAWSPDGQKLAWSMVEDDNGIYIWNRQTDRVSSLRGHKSSVWPVAWSPGVRGGGALQGETFLTSVFADSAVIVGL